MNSQLTDDERRAGRSFRESQRRKLTALNKASPPDIVTPDFIAVYRHRCAGRENRSTPMDLNEIYVASPIYPEHGVPAGRFGFIYREGRCRGCGQSARSKEGRLVDGFTRPPISGRVARS